MDFSIITKNLQSGSDKSNTNKSGKNNDKINFSTEGLKFDTQKQSSKNSKPKPTAFSASNKDYPVIPDGCEYDIFLKKKTETDKLEMMEQDQKEKNQSTRKENHFGVKYIPISGFHFGRVFPNENNQEFAPESGTMESFRQTSHISNMPF